MLITTKTFSVPEYTFWKLDVWIYIPKCVILIDKNGSKYGLYIILINHDF
jgi:hypothetical protein